MSRFNKNGVNLAGRKLDKFAEQQPVVQAPQVEADTETAATTHQEPEQSVPVTEPKSKPQGKKRVRKGK